LAQNRSQNQAFEGGCFKHHSRLLDRPTPDFLALSFRVLKELLKADSIESPNRLHDHTD
jgi:hypothetical protein